MRTAIDDVPSRSTERSRTENEDAARGIHDVATEFAAMRQPTRYAATSTYPAAVVGALSPRSIAVPSIRAARVQVGTIYKYSIAPTAHAIFSAPYCSQA